MSANIGGTACTFVKGAVQTPKERGETWTVIGHDGIGAIKLGKGDAVFRLTGVLYESNANVEIWRKAIEAMQYTVIDAEDDHGETYSNLIVTQVSDLIKITVKNEGVLKKRGEIVIIGQVRPV